MPKLTASAKKCSFVIIWAKHVSFPKWVLMGVILHLYHIIVSYLKFTSYLNYLRCCAYIFMLSSKVLFFCQNILGEYSTWLSSSNTREANFYLECFHERWAALVAQEERVLLDPNGLINEGEKLTVKALDGFNASSTAKVFEEEIREVVCILWTRIPLCQFICHENICLTLLLFGSNYKKCAHF